MVSVGVCLSGGLGCLWAVVWFALASDDPRTHRGISREEKEYIINSIGPQVHVKHLQTAMLSFFAFKENISGRNWLVLFHLNIMVMVYFLYDMVKPSVFYLVSVQLFVNMLSFS